MKFTILEKKNGSTYVLYDNKNGGMACVTPYTIRQLAEHGHTVVGATFTPKFKAVPHTRDGLRQLKQMSYDIPLTKRSAVTCEKGLKPVKKKTKKKPVCKPKKVFKSKCQCYLEKWTEECGEYHTISEKYYYRIEASSISALPEFIRLVQKYSWIVDVHKSHYYEQVKKGRTVSECIQVPDMLENTDKCQVFAADKVIFNFFQHYEDYSFTVAFFKQDAFQPVVRSCYHCNAKDADFIFGITADAGQTLKGTGNWLKKLNFKS